VITKCPHCGGRLTVDEYGHLERLEAALRKLSNEVGGLSIGKPEIIQAISLTNWNCLMTRLHEAQDVLCGSSAARIFMIFGPRAFQTMRVSMRPIY
jgi:hypothetical protein